MSSERQLCNEVLTVKEDNRNVYSFSAEYLKNTKMKFLVMTTNPQQSKPFCPLIILLIRSLIHIHPWHQAHYYLSEGELRFKATILL